MIRAAEHAGKARHLVEKRLLAHTLLFGQLQALDLLRRFRTDDEHTAHARRRRRIVDRAIAIGPVDVLEFAVARDRDEGIFLPCGAASGHDLIDLRADDRPDLGPDLTARLAKRRRMALRADRPGIGIVVEAQKVRPPPDIHRVPGIQDQPHGGAQHLGPGFRLAQRRFRPPHVLHVPGHFAFAGKERGVRHACFRLGVMNGVATRAR